MLSPLTRAGGWPRLCLTMASLVEKLKAAYALVTGGKFVDALAAFGDIMAAITLVAPESRQQLHELKELLTICREYSSALRLEVLRKSLDPAREPKRVVELAAYFTHAKLQVPHVLLYLRSAMTLSFKLKLFRVASGFARRLLELDPRPDMAATAKKVIKM